jgi:hypothetical protein
MTGYIRDFSFAMDNSVNVAVTRTRRTRPSFATLQKCGKCGKLNNNNNNNNTETIPCDGIAILESVKTDVIYAKHSVL